jgi:hypothetical protein
MKTGDTVKVITEGRQQNGHYFSKGDLVTVIALYTPPKDYDDGFLYDLEARDGNGLRQSLRLQDVEEIEKENEQ